MQSEPASLPLLLAAREWLLDELMPNISLEKRYDALLIASSMAIVARELEAGGDVLEAQRQQECERLRSFYPEVAEQRGQDVECLRELSARLVRDIRAGRFDRPGPESEALRRLLRDATVDKLKTCNPGYLELEGTM